MCSVFLASSYSEAQRGPHTVVSLSRFRKTKQNLSDVVILSDYMIKEEFFKKTNEGRNTYSKYKESTI